MKAKLKGTGFIVNVSPCYSDGQLTGYQDMNTPPGTLRYSPEQLDFISEPDWDAYRREAAKAIFAGMVTSLTIQHSSSQTVTDMICTAIEYADELIRQLKEEEE